MGGCVGGWVKKGENEEFLATGGKDERGVGPHADMRRDFLNPGKFVFKGGWVDGWVGM